MGYQLSKPCCCTLFANVQICVYYQKHQFGLPPTIIVTDFFSLCKQGRHLLVNAGAIVSKNHKFKLLSNSSKKGKHCLHGGLVIPKQI